MTNTVFECGDLVKLLAGNWQGVVGIVTQPITEESMGHVLVHTDGYIFGVRASLKDVVRADRTSEGFAQLAYNLIKLGSHVIEQRLI